MVEPISSWSLRGKCYGTNGKLDDILFPDDAKNASLGKKYCTGCDVKALCSIYAIAHDDYGIWGGTSHTERLKTPEFAKEAIVLMFQSSGQLEYRGLKLIVPEEDEELSEEQLPGVTDVPDTGHLEFG